jgi:hypothetical protein
MKTKKKLNHINITRKNIFNKMNTEITKKQVTTPRDLKTILTGYVRSENYNSIPEWVEIYKTDFPGPLDKETINSLISQVQNIEFSDKEEMESYLDLVLYDNTAEDYNETTYTAFIKIYSDFRYVDIDKIKENLSFMMQNDIKVKRRTIAPILELCKSTNDLSLCLSMYGVSKSRNLLLLEEDYMNILSTIHAKSKKDYFNIMMLIDDMTRSYYTIGQECQIVLDTIFPKNTPIIINSEGVIDSGKVVLPIKKLNSFKFTSKDITIFSDQMEHHVANIHPKKKKLLLEFKKFLKKIKYDTVIDGANVGFFKQGVNSGKVLNFNQIRMFVDKAVSLGRKVLLVLHERHIRKIKQKDTEILDYIKTKTKCFFSPQGMDDDMYWLYASITNPNANIITNDEMRNHIVNISVGEMFTEWKRYKVIKYNILNGEVMLKIPPKYMTKPIVLGKHLIIPFTNKEDRISWKYYSY